MDDPTYSVPPVPPVPPLPPGPPMPPAVRGPRQADPPAVALGNASLLGGGYLLLGRRLFAGAAVVVTVVLVSVVVSTAEPWAEIAVGVWWVAVVAHGWFLARAGVRPASARRQRLVAAGVALPVLLAVGLLRFDAHTIERDVDEARRDGDCAKVLSAQDEVWFGHRVADAPGTAGGDEVVDTCERLRDAGARLTTGLTGDTRALEAGFDGLGTVLDEPGNDEIAGSVLTDFLDGLPTDDACGTVTVTDWLRDRKPSRDARDRSADTAERTAPKALVKCGDDHMTAEDWTQARTRYQQLLDEYPENAALADQARKGVRKATLTIELENVRRLLETPVAGEQPEYCTAPARYSGAKPYGKGVNRGLFHGNDGYTDRLPGSWRTDDPARAVLVVCAGAEQDGTALRTCPYEREQSPGSIVNVTFHKTAIPVKVYELRTGKLVANRKVQINGESCPQRLSYWSVLDPPSDVRATPSTTDIRNAFRSLIDR